jgi:PBP1b-binding outer membrane lipoprotein LpoB
MKFFPLAVATLAFALAACSSSNAPEEAKAKGPQKTVFDAQFKALDKAKAEQGVIDKQKADMDKRLNEQEGGGKQDDGGKQ